MRKVNKMSRKGFIICFILFNCLFNVENVTWKHKIPWWLSARQIVKDVEDLCRPLHSRKIFETYLDDPHHSSFRASQVYAVRMDHHCIVQERELNKPACQELCTLYVGVLPRSPHTQTHLHMTRVLQVFIPTPTQILKKHPYYTGLDSKLCTARVTG